MASDAGPKVLHRGDVEAVKSVLRIGHGCGFKRVVGLL
jgi:hypothetical protein